MSTGSSSSPSNWVTGSYTGNSDGLRITITIFVVIAWYNSIELMVLIFSIFKQYKGIYFWSLLISTAGILPYSIGFFMKFFDLTSAIWVSLTLVTVGWWTMVTGQSFVLYSRLHLVVQNTRLLNFVCCMIIANVFLLHVPTTVLTYAANYEQSYKFLHAYNIMERVQVAGFCAQELIISGIYIWETTRMLKLNPNRDNRNIILQLFMMNLVCILMDIALIAVECANYYIYQTTLKATVYSIKLKIEYGVLNKLIYIAKQSAGRPAEDPYIELSRLSPIANSDATRTTTQSKPRRSSIEDISFRLRPIIRVTPDEVHINDVGYLDTIYAPSMTRLDKYDYQLRTLRVPGGVGTTADYYLHRIRREALPPFFSKRNVLWLESVITEKVNQLCGLIAKHAATKTPEAARLRHNSHELLKGINMNKHFPWIPDILEALPQLLTRPTMPPGLIDMLELFDRVRAELTTIITRISSNTSGEKESINTGAKGSVYESVLDSPNLPASEKALLRLEQEGALLTLAGTESPAQTLNIIFYHLLANPALLAKLREELATLPTLSTWTQLEQLPYLSAIIEEGNRLSFGVTARTARIQHTPITYTPSAITTLSAHTAELVFLDPYAFLPERWLGDEGRERRKFQLAFSRGGRKCLGVELARAELYLVTAALVRKFDLVLWETDERDVSFEHDYHVAMPRDGSTGVRVVARIR
ncbi:cytochrome P450 [Aspergillus flavus]|uniref:Cytochrome P450 n=1 Tax=Aspergillus flavus (strain ATCC 200026 / FGSC A1120 / IAM 13836 / NRRL 3357 / JCM 12722 / SRRC 167) TaxID=332952 RepID=A0A7U2R034_ASPFN|nr:cytochrome P450 [Aspergillus flavus]